MERLRQAKVYTAIKTPYTASGKIDLKSYDFMVERQIAAGVDGLIVGGTTGEGHLMAWDEHIMLIAHTAKCYGNKLLTIGNTGSNNTREALHATEQGFAVGMDAALQINPYYGKTSKKGILAHLEALMALGPALIYNVPGRTGQDILPEVVEILADHENFIGMKECKGLERVKDYEAQGIACWSGNDDECHDTRHQGNSHGVVSVASNILPATMVKLMNQENQDLNNRLQPLFSWLFKEPNPIALNTICAMLGWCEPVFRLPYVAYDEALRKEGKEILETLALELKEEIQLLSDEDFLYVA